MEHICKTKYAFHWLLKVAKEGITDEFTHGNIQAEHMVRRQVLDHKKSNLDCNHYLEAIEDNFELRTKERNRFH